MPSKPVPAIHPQPEVGQPRREHFHFPLCQVDTNTHYECDLIGKKLRYAQVADSIRLDKLIEHGGVYADIDTLFVRPFPDHLFVRAFVIGRGDRIRNPETSEWSAPLCKALMFSEPVSAFARRWSNCSRQLAARRTARCCHGSAIRSLLPSHVHPGGDSRLS
ncbi:MAG: glycosyltransferase [Verrucomicrobiales bacterium]